MEPGLERRWGPFVAGLLMVLGLGLCLATLALAWWWTRAGEQAGAAPTPAPAVMAVATPTATVLPAHPPPRISPPATQHPSVSPATATPAPAVDTPVPPASVPSPQPQGQGETAEPLMVEDFSLFQGAQVLEALFASPAGRPVTVTVQEETLNRDLSRLLAEMEDEGPVPLADVMMELRPEGVYVSGEAKVGFLRGRFLVLAQVSAQGCTLQVAVQKVHMGGLPAPAVVRQELEKYVAQYLNPWLQSLPVCVEQVLLERGKATIAGHR